MLKKIEKIGNLGLVFQDFKWDENAPEFKQFNFVYGWNGTGKTSLSRLFDLIAGTTESQVSYVLRTEDERRHDGTSPYPYEIRVFNQDYTMRNLDVVQGKANAISILLGQENKDAVSRMDAIETQLFGEQENPDDVGDIQRLRQMEKDIAAKRTARDRIFTDVASTIGEVVSLGGSATRNYRRPNAIEDFKAIKNPTVLSDGKAKQQRESLNQEVRSELKWNPPTLTVDGQAKDLLSWCDEAFAACVSLGDSTAASKTIDHLQSNPDVADWVEKGLALHTESQTCEYCQNIISEERISELAAHFNEEDRLLKTRIDAMLDHLRLAYSSANSMTVLHTQLLYPEMRKDADNLVSKIEEMRNKLVKSISEVGELLTRKRRTTGEKIELLPPDTHKQLKELLVQFNSIVQSHNEKTHDFAKLREAAVEELKTHHLSKIHSEVTGIDDELLSLDENSKALSEKIQELEAENASLRGSISSDHKAAELLTENLHAFLGRDELSFVVPEGSEGEDDILGYEVRRGGNPAEYLSEGEKTAIAFVYFIVHLGDGQFDRKQGVVVVDDPVSSLDSASMYQAFAFLKGAIRDCHQCFVLTHNFEFLKLLLNWAKSFKKRRSLYMIKNRFIDGRRSAFIDALDPTLEKLDSEYQYLFKCLKDLEKAQDGTIAAAYAVPNMARKLWDSFLLYRVPSSQSIHKKCEVLKENGFDAQKIDAIYKFTNDQSHVTGSGLNPSLVPEASNVISNIFELMQVTAPEHYKVLEKEISSQ